MSTTEDRQLRARVDKLREELNYHAKKRGGCTGNIRLRVRPAFL